MKHLTTLLLTLLVLGGCSTELDRCIAFSMENNPKIESEIEYWSSPCGNDSNCIKEVQKEQETKYELIAKAQCHEQGIY